MKYYSEENNGQGQQKMITKGKLRGYVNWLNETKGGSFLRATASGSNKLVIKRMSDISGGTIHWTATRDTQSSQLTASTTTSSITITSNSSSRIPRGKFYLVGPDGTQYTELDNSNTGDNYSGFEDMTFIEADEKEDTYCLTYSDLSGETYARVFDEATMKDGIVIDGYSIGSGEQYKSFQLVAEKDVNFGKLTYDLVVSSITIEVDAMNDLEEYKRGVIPGSNDLAYATVYEKTNGSGTLFHNFDLNGVELTDNAETSGKTYTGVSITKGNSVATAPIVQSGSSSAYTLDVYFYADSGYTLSSKTISTKVGKSTTVPICASTHSFSSNSTAPAYSASSRVVNVSIASNGQVTFGIKQRKEIYGYFPVDVYRQGSDDFAIDENGNVELSAINKFVKAFVGTSWYDYIATFYPSYTATSVANKVSGWTDNAGDNFGPNGLSNGKISLTSLDASSYDEDLIEQGVVDLTVCGKDVYNMNDVVYDRGEQLGASVYHVAYANDAYGNMNNEGGFKDTRHFFCSGGTLNPSATKPTCTDKHIDYSYDTFTSDIDYDVEYSRVYYKDMHSYGLTSILRRFRKIGDTFRDTSLSSYQEVSHQGVPEKVPTSQTISGNNFPKHILGRTFTLTLTSWFNNVHNIKAGSNNVTGWTTIFESEEASEGSNWASLSHVGNPTVRNIRMAYESDWHKLICESKNTGNTYFYEIHPFYYMVDAESCEGKSSGYTFSIPKTITDYAYNTTSVRDYYLDDNHYFLTRNYSNNQMCRKSMITYLNVESNGTPILDSTRYGTSYTNGYVKTDCCPSAPKEKLYWVDEYAPGDYGGKVFVKGGLSLVDDDDVIIDSVYGIWVVPGYYVSWPSNGITIERINEFTGSSSYSFAGPTTYNTNTNGSSKSLIDSVSYCSGLTYNDDGRYSSGLGFKIVSEPYSGVVHAISGVNGADVTDYYVDGDGRKIYNGDEYVYFDSSGTMHSTWNKNNYKFCAPLYSNIRSYDTSYAPETGLRPCRGDVTVPYWTAEMYFATRIPSGETYNSDPIEGFGMKVVIDGVTLAANNHISQNDIYYGLITSDDTEIILKNSSTPTDSRSGVYAKLTKINETTVGDEIIQKVKLSILFIDVYKEFDVKITSDVYSTQVLHWKLDGKPSTKLGAGIIYALGSNGWVDYTDTVTSNSNMRTQDTSSNDGPPLLGNPNGSANCVPRIIAQGSEEFKSFFPSSMYPCAYGTSISNHKDSWW